MNVFETMIRDAIANGMNIDDIGKNIAESLNKITEEEMHNNKRRNAVKNMTDEMWARIDNDEEISFEVAALMATIAAAAAHPDWDEEVISLYKDSVLSHMELCGRIMTNDPMAILANLFDEASSALETRGKEKKDVPSSSCMRIAAPIGKTDQEKVMAFLKTLS